MNTSHGYFRSGSYLLIRHLDIPQTGCGRLGVLVVPPFGWEEVCAYRSLRLLGQTLAENGIPALRFDLPGTGDSSGSATDTGLVDAWIQSVGDAATELRAATGVEQVAVIGIRLGAMLAAAAAARGANLQDMVLWAPAVSGRAMLRELRLLHKMEVMEYANRDAPPPQPIPGLQNFGFLLTPETQASLESLDLSTLPHLPARRVMVLVRDDCPSDQKVIDALKAWGYAVEVTAGSGYNRMMAPPHEAICPKETIRAVVEFITRDVRQQSPGQEKATPANPGLTNGSANRPATVIEDAGTTVVESIHTLEGSSGPIFGVLSEPGSQAPLTGLCLLFLNPGAARHIGPNRMWVEAARRWAARGVPSLRMDFAGIGESHGQSEPDVASLYEGPFLEQVQMAMHSLRSRAGARKFAVIGLCSGAFWAFHAAVRDPDVRGAILLNPRLFFWDPEVDRRRMLRSTIDGLGNSARWRRLATGRIKPERIKQAARGVIGLFRNTDGARDHHAQIPAEALAQSLAAVEKYQSRLTLIFTEGEPLLREMDEEAQLPPENNPRIRCIRISNGGHTFRPLWAQKQIHELIDRDLDLVLLDVLKEQCASVSG